MIERIARYLPSSLLRFIGRLQYSVPFLGPAIRRGAKRIAQNEGRIQRGVGEGLKFRATVPVAGYILGTTEPELQQAFVNHIKSGDVVYDLGANVGFYTLLAAKLVGSEGHVYAFEPFSESLKTAQLNLEMNGFFHVTWVQKAVADGQGREWLEMGMSPVTFKLSESRGAEGMEVEVTSIDAFLQEERARPPSFIKIDVEGAELRALQGMKETLSRYRPTVLCEVHYAVSDFEHFVEELLGPLGYHVKSIDGQPIPRSGARFHVIIEPKRPI